jgi:uncharacterized protein (DUF302 family)
MSADYAEYESAAAFAPTLECLTKAIEAAGMTIFARIDHAAAAKSVGLDMPATMVLIYGNPKGGTPLMLAAPRVALDLPLRVLVRAEGRRVLVGFHPAAAMLRAAGVSEALATRLEPAQHVLVEAITK